MNLLNTVSWIALLSRLPPMTAESYRMIMITAAGHLRIVPK